MFVVSRMHLYNTCDHTLRVLRSRNGQVIVLRSEAVDGRYTRLTQVTFCTMADSLTPLRLSTKKRQKASTASVHPCISVTDLLFIVVFASVRQRLVQRCTGSNFGLYLCYRHSGTSFNNSTRRGQSIYNYVPNLSFLIYVATIFQPM
jgi:hypothetical protein